MIALSSWPLHCQPARALGDAAYISLPLRCRQQEINRNAERLSDLLMQHHWAFALSSFEVGQIALSNVDCGSKLGLRHGAPFAQRTNRALVSRQQIDNSLWDHDLATRRDVVARIVHEASGADILVGDELGEPLVFASWKDGELLAARGLDKLNLGHDSLSVVDLASMTNRNNDDRIGFGVEYDPPITYAQPGARTPLESFDVTLPGSCICLELGVEPMAHISGEIEPLTRRSGCQHDLHGADIADRDILVKNCIAYCDSRGCT